MAFTFGENWALSLKEQSTERRRCGQRRRTREKPRWSVSLVQQDYEYLTRAEEKLGQTPVMSLTNAMLSLLLLHPVISQQIFIAVFLLFWLNYVYPIVSCARVPLI